MSWPTLRLPAALRRAVSPAQKGPVETMTADSVTQIVVCTDAAGKPLSTLYIRGMCEELGMAPTMMRWAQGQMTSVPLWDARANRSEVEEPFLGIMRRYNDLVGLGAKNFKVVNSNQ